MLRYTVDSLNRLEDIKEDKDIKQLSHALFPGTHCPLFGVGLTASYIEDLVILVVGTSECTFYVKDFSHGRQRGRDKVFSLVTDKNDVVFGSDKKLEKALRHIDEKYKPKVVMVVTTCVLELIGEDFHGLTTKLQPEIDAKILVVQTEHFKCNSHIPGIERMLEALSGLMKSGEKEKKKINILGHRLKGVEETELIKALRSESIEINTVIPSKCTIEELENAPCAAVNIVTEFTAVKLAEKMEADFGVPYVYFDKHLSLEKIDEAYHRLGEYLNINIKERVASSRESLVKKLEEARVNLKGKTFFYGNTPMNAFELSSFLCHIGMEPILIQARELYENDPMHIAEISSLGHNPYVSRIANIAPLRDIYDDMRPDYYLGHENPMNLIKRNIVQVTLDNEGKGIGYELPESVIDKILLSSKDFHKMKERMGKMMKGGHPHGTV